MTYGGAIGTLDHTRGHTLVPTSTNWVVNFLETLLIGSTIKNDQILGKKVEGKTYRSKRS